MTQQQTSLFPAPDAAPTPRKVRYLAFDATCDDENHHDLFHLCEGEEPGGTPTDTGDHVDQLIDDGADPDEQWLHDTLTDTLYEPGDWPENDEVRAVALHRVALAELAGV